MDASFRWHDVCVYVSFMTHSLSSYLDYCASAPLKPAAKAAMSAALEEHGNASSIHGFGRRQRALVEKARGALADVLAVKPAQVVFTAGATEANVTALHGVGAGSRIVSAIEHPSILQTAPDAAQIRVGTDGVIDLNHLEELLKAAAKPALVSLIYVNNETGVVQPVREAAALARAHGALLHVDAVQALGRVGFTLAGTGADMLSLSAHKIGGPQGAGALVLRENLPLKPLLTGGGQEMRRRAGTENVAALAGFGAALESIGDDLARQSEWAGWRDAFETMITAEAPEAVFFGQKAPRAGNISCLAMPGVKNDIQLMAFDLAGVAVSSGSACSSGKVTPSHVLKAMGADEKTASSAIRASFGSQTHKDELPRLAGIWLELWRKKGQSGGR
jgi:cysteine desulfurase